MEFFVSFMVFFLSFGCSTWGNTILLDTLGDLKLFNITARKDKSVWKKYIENVYGHISGTEISL